jgi:hypothetical protein
MASIMTTTGDAYSLHLAIIIEGRTENLKVGTGSDIRYILELQAKPDIRFICAIPLPP